ncbi:hypothetical protein GCM10007108_11110 [Thermogymnomonas acidicola]|uniref:Geranylgeranylglycerol-phosphate geranylgeranyltransferase n=1 Tax=Thermogymnomonas acidicola TaxID=399579 RepID=A0AA37BRJ4_9ARCH|nr:UbiA family prenyltransferase [Thermogymnomonas acidicola]GGM74919.1 hypothetical protein GCM10007108_11110 [Thermogymnomonas acidicola]
MSLYLRCGGLTEENTKVEVGKPGYGNPVHVWLRFIRPVNGFMGLFATWISAFIGKGTGLVHFVVPVAVASAVVFLVTSGGNIINDITDIETDRINHPERPLVTGSISRGQARAAAAALFVIPVVLSAVFLPPLSTLIVLLAEALLILYEARTKRLGLTGNISISALVGLIFIFGGLAVGSPEKMVILFLMAFLANLSRELIKGVEDIKGDRDRQTFPKRYGVGATQALVASCIALAVGLSSLPYLLHLLNLFYVPVVVVSDALFVFSAVGISRDTHRKQQISKLAMIVGLASFVVGGI